MRFAILMIACLLPASALANEMVEAKRVAVIVGINRPSSQFEAVPNAHESAASLVETLGSTAGYVDVRALIGPVASAATVLDTVRSAMHDIGEDGFLLFVFVGHGVGGDFGEPALMTHGASVRAPLQTGLDVVELSAALKPTHATQQILIVVDATQLGDVEGVALVGPRASEWPNADASGLTVITPSSTAASGAGTNLVTVLNEALSGAADVDADGYTRLTELFRWVGGSMTDTSGSLIDTSGMKSSDRVVAHHREKTWASTDQKNGRVVSKAVLVSGVAMGVASAAMYAGKRGQCDGTAGNLNCGEGPAYRRYQRVQHALGGVGLGLMVAGAGIHFASGPSGIGVRVGGTF